MEPEKFFRVLPAEFDGNDLNDNFGPLGFVIIGFFALSWVGSVIIYRVKGFDRLELPVKTTDQPSAS
jgi:hypothetical protein